MIVLLNLKI